MITLNVYRIKLCLNNELNSKKTKKQRNKGSKKPKML